ncbi:unnamed protein product [Albugo candida]|uniref:CUE domain-containing protein n=1 Tax=Albugo candida TaxID=65357 RepID=A0A024GKF7_9STRA|nr:unnamed protein product [Albugo candida]|eukprot:CCI47356.1 unnamed protein product [Albugo candida]
MYDDELSILCEMFPSWEASALFLVLMEHQGGLESTIETVLSMETPAITREAISSATSTSLTQVSTTVVDQPPNRFILDEQFLRLPTHLDVSRDSTIRAGHNDHTYQNESLDGMLQERFVCREGWPTTRSRGWSSQKDPRSTRLLAEVASDAITTAKEKIITAGGVAKERMHQWYVSFHTRCDLTIPAEDRSLQPLISRYNSDDEAAKY